MALRIEILQGEAPLIVKDAAQLDEALGQAAEEAQKRGMLGAVLIEAENRNVLTMVVGGDETVLGFDDYDDHNLRCYASRGASNGDEPIMTCYLAMHHHTEFPRKNVIPLPDGVKAVREFLDSGGLPTCINWEEV
jgi:Immunity protein Imm1